MFWTGLFASLLASVLVIIAERHIDFKSKVKFIYRRLGDLEYHIMIKYRMYNVLYRF